MKILNDAGHGGKDSGAVSHDGKVLEKDIALKVTLRVHELLSPHGESFLSRDDDTFLTLTERAEKANLLAADLLSIHCNAGGGRGIEVFTSPGETLSDPWATCVLEELDHDFPDQIIRADFSDGDSDKEQRFMVLTKTRRSAILVELGFIDTEEGQRFLTSPVNQERLAQAIARGTLRHHGISAPVRPKLTLEQRVERLEQLHAQLP
ncbi:N-acetylmuramoyl-L-alanine amidase (plasmid) [Verrucomicrobiaceae bacterium 227]